MLSGHWQLKIAMLKYTCVCFCSKQEYNLSKSVFWFCTAIVFLTFYCYLFWKSLKTCFQREKLHICKQNQSQQSVRCICICIWVDDGRAWDTWLMPPGSKQEEYKGKKDEIWLLIKFQSYLFSQHWVPSISQ